MKKITDNAVIIRMQANEKGGIENTIKRYINKIKEYCEIRGKGRRLEVMQCK